MVLPKATEYTSLWISIAQSVHFKPPVLYLMVLGGGGGGGGGGGSITDLSLLDLRSCYLQIHRGTSLQPKILFPHTINNFGQQLSGCNLPLVWHNITKCVAHSILSIAETRESALSFHHQ